MAILLLTTITLPSSSSASLSFSQPQQHASSSSSSSARNLFAWPLLSLGENFIYDSSTSRCFSRSTVMAAEEDNGLTSSQALLLSCVKDVERDEDSAGVKDYERDEYANNKRVGFFLDDGVLYTSLHLNVHGFPVVCNGKGCRPLTGPECKKLGLLTIQEDDAESGMAMEMEAHYQKLLQEDPGNALLLTNYARFLSRRGDMKRSEEHYERAILADPHDAEILSEYARLQWDVHKDKERAQMYYEQALQAAAAHAHDDGFFCSDMVMASYASFLLESESNDLDVAPPAHPCHD